MSKKIERENQILSILLEKNGASVRKLSQIVGVSEMTIRRDLAQLQAKDYVSVVQGVAIINRNQDGSAIQKNYTLDLERDLMKDKKKRIGLAAAAMIEANDTIIIDTGTTTEVLAENLPNLPVTIVCYNLNILSFVQSHNISSLIFCGGYYHENTQMFESPENVALISRICANKVFCSAAGISAKGAVTCIDQYEIATKQAALRSAVTSILLIDSSKFGKIRPSLFANLADFDVIVTDSDIPQSWINLIKNSGVELNIV